MRYFIELCYNGKNYHGWQRQPNACTIQEVLEDKLSTFFGDTISVTGAGRTDAGVHARQFFAHTNLDGRIPDQKLIEKLNSFLPKDISILNIWLVNDDAHARFDAYSRSYEYLINLSKDPFTHELAYYLKRVPDIDLMNAAASSLLNYKNFQCFSRSNTDVKTYNCTIYDAKWVLNENKLRFFITADRFLRNMVRAIVGTLLDIGFKKNSIEDLHRIIESKDRSEAGASVPANGLYLTEIKYPQGIFKNESLVSKE